ncbi:hypothetical protein CIK04_03390 [Vibrio sp. 03_296]|uniref:DUF559 domain-containing protein n=1 Tax=Vibrio TaxID=662 RepID=UPI000BCDCE55|nr:MULTISPECIES: DUF559 domain-containing protein [Vibrio]OZT86175.1 hypothetical protein CIK04_03390 [Vibrio sp. 03_296]PJO10948.1 DUF559 domain-containing protein [Vibrio vulnificus]
MFNLTCNISKPQVSRETVELTANSMGVDCNTSKPIPYDELSFKLGHTTSLLILCLSKNPKVSAPALRGTVELISKLSTYPSFKVASLTMNNYPDFSLETWEKYGLFSEDLENFNNISHFFRITPELKVPKTSLGLNSRGAFELDLSLELIVVKGGIEHSAAKVVVEFDGPLHLNSDNVRADKLRDSFVQSQGATVFRVQSVNTHDLNRAQQDEKSHEQLMAHIENIKEHFRNRLFAVLSIP